MDTEQKIMARLLRNAFDKCRAYWQRDEAISYIKVARYYNLNEDADEMENDLKI